MKSMETVSSAPKYTLKKRAAQPIEGIERQDCYDLIVEDGDGCAVLEDAAGSQTQALRLLGYFQENRVGSLEAPYVMEDLLADADYIE